MIDIRTDRLKLVPFGEGSNRSVNENNCKIDIPENIINNEINFLICNTCFWCASVYSTTNRISRINCSVCNDASNLESIPISKEESFRINCIPKTGNCIRVFTIDNNSLQIKEKTQDLLVYVWLCMLHISANKIALTNMKYWNNMIVL
jgi:hypothetical protein